MWIDNKLLLTIDEAEEQIARWNETDGSYPRNHVYSLYHDREAGTTPPLPGMRDQDLIPRTRAGVGHVVGQGGDCWCGARHADAVPGDHVSLPSEYEGMPMMYMPYADEGVESVEGVEGNLEWMQPQPKSEPIPQAASAACDPSDLDYI
jgi:hypothetical protein